MSNNIDIRRVVKSPFKIPYGMSNLECLDLLLRDSATVNLSIRQVEFFKKDEYIRSVVRDEDGMIKKFCFRSFPAQRTIDECYHEIPNDEDECTIIIDLDKIRNIIFADPKTLILTDRVCIDYVIEFQ